MSDVQETLTRLFDRHRIVFLYDEANELKSEFDGVEIGAVEKVEVANNEFSLKYRMLRLAPKQKFLVYRSGQRPKDIDNWLLDVELAHEEFRATQVGLWLSSLGLSYDFAKLVEEHAGFFKSSKRRESLKALLSDLPTASQIRTAMLLVCVNSTDKRGRIDVVLELLLDEMASGKDERWRQIERSGLAGFLWEQTERVYGYRSDSPGVHDFVITLFKSCYAMHTHGEVRLTGEAQVFLRRWKDSRSFHESFRHHSKECAQVLAIGDDLKTRDFRSLADVDYFELIDRKVLSDLAKEVEERKISAGQCVQYIRSRRAGHWYQDYRHHYAAIETAASFLEAINAATLEMDSFDDGIRRYTQTWWQVDSLYRQFVFHSRESNSTTLFEGLSQIIEQQYSNRFLLPLGDRWQAIVDQSEAWSPQAAQRAFFLTKVQTPFLSKNKKVCIIISDGLRYEIGQEFAERIRRENRYSATISYMVTGLPSYTQLGMAALLPNQKLQINLDESATVSVDGRNSAGTDNRNTIVAGVPGKKGTAIQARDLLAMNATDSRALFRDHDFVYVYHNAIDSTGDKAATESDVFEAADETIDTLVQLVKKLTAANASNILVTADHGFIYQNGVDESDFVASAANSVESDYRDRRFLLGKHLPKPPGMHHYTSAQLGLDGDVEVLIPNSINRLRLSGSGFRYVHGGSTLQEVVVPLIEINKSKQDDVQQVPVQIIPSSSTTISTGQLAVRLYQEEAASEKLQPRTLSVGLYSEAGEALSDIQEVVFDRTSDNPREREHTVKLVLSRDADEYNGKQVYLRLKERIGATTHFTDYLNQTFTIRRSFEQDFDF